MPFDPALPRPFTSSSVRQFAPAASGVYGISNASEWLLLGETDNIQAGLLSHFSAPSAPLGPGLPTGFVFELCGRPSRLARFDQLMREYRPSRKCLSPLA